MGGSGDNPILFCCSLPVLVASCVTNNCRVTVASRARRTQPALPDARTPSGWKLHKPPTQGRQADQRQSIISNWESLPDLLLSAGAYRGG